MDPAVVSDCSRCPTRARDFPDFIPAAGRGRKVDPFSVFATSSTSCRAPERRDARWQEIADLPLLSRYTSQLVVLGELPGRLVDKLVTA